MRWIPAALYAVAIVVLSSMPSHSFPRNELLTHDKVLHFIEFCALGALVMWAWRRTWLAFVLCAAFAALDEVHQMFTPGRDASALDAIADVAGALLGVGLCWLLLRRLQDSATRAATRAANDTN